MNAQRWLAELRLELARCNLPPRYVARLVTELSDHLTDSQENLMSMDATDLHGVFDQLGTPREVAGTAAAEYRRAKFSRRHPILMFVVLPLVSLPLLWTAKIVGVILLIKLIGIRQEDAVLRSNLWQFADAALPYVMLSISTVPVAIAATLFCLLARRADVSWRWPAAACLLLAIVGGAAVAQLTLPTAAAKGSLSFGFGLSTHPSPQQWLQFVLPLAICCAAIWRQISANHRHVTSA